MTARIDHATDANTNLETIADAIRESGRVSLTETIAIAQVQATLALVEQQHIANMQTERDNLRARAGGRTDPTATRLGEQASALDLCIREGLGL